MVCKKGKGKLTRGKKGAAQEGKGATDGGNIEFKTLDWETDEVSNVSQGEDFDLVIAADCIYNSHLIPPLVATLRDACRLREEGKGKTVALIAQQLRSDEVLEEFLKEFNKYFRIWRVGDEWFKAVEGLGEVSGFVLHIGVLKD